MSNQEDRQVIVRTATSTTLPFDGDWIQLFNDTVGVTGETFNEMLLSYINTKLGTSYTNINEAKQAFADNGGFYNWDSMNTFTA